MLSDQEKKEMLEDALSQERRRAFARAERRGSQEPVSLNDYIAFLMDVQKIKPFEHKRVVTKTEKNRL